MVRAATEGNERFEVSDIEVAREGVSYTVDTLRQLRAERPDDELALIVGGDSAVGFASWREPRTILDLARLVIYARPGADLGAVPEWVMARAIRVDGPLLQVSSTALRGRIAAGRTVRYLVPDAVRLVVAERGLYRGATGIGEDGGS